MADKATTETRKPPRPSVKENIATDDDMKRMFSIVEQAERKHEAMLAEIRDMKTEGKAKLEKAYTDAVDALKSRGVTKRILRELYEESRREADDRREHYQAKLWAMKACGMPISHQGDLFEAQAPTTSAGQDPDLAAPAPDALARIYERGRQAHLDNAPLDANPYEEGTRAHDEWNRGRADAQEETVMAMAPAKGKKGKGATAH